ncbi:MAG: dockerin type I domain-containing protein, partial [Planctomycetota bacterium]|nr:dockerin type I domain-containing protein [Planctomycetota bacterium]
FIAMMWPEVPGSYGEPDTTTTLCEAPVDSTPVFLGWIQKEELLLPAGAYPGTWTDRVEELVYPPRDEPGPHLPILGATSKSTECSLAGEFQEAFAGRPLIDQDGNFVLYQIFYNRSLFEYFSQNGYYDAVNQVAGYEADGQLAPVPQTGVPSDFDPPIDLPPWFQQGTIAIKVAWKQLSPSEIDSGRFFMRDVYYAGNLGEAPCRQVTIGMIGFHVLQLTPRTRDTWFWATFEQVDVVEQLPDSPFEHPLLNPGDTDPDCAPPYDNGYSCDAAACTPSDPTGETDCPPFPPRSGEPRDVCLTHPDLTVNVSRIPEMTIPGVVDDLNAEIQTQLPAPWRHYRLLNTIFPADPNEPDQAGECCIAPEMPGLERNAVNTCWLTNTTMETYTQYFQFNLGGALPKCEGAPAASMSCTDCHAIAAPIGAPLVVYEGFPFPDPTVPTAQIFTFALNNAKSSCQGDFNYDGIVNAADLGQLLGAWELDRRCPNSFDLNADGNVNAADLGILLTNWGGCPVTAPAHGARGSDTLVEDEEASERTTRSGFRRLARNIIP